MDKQKNSTDNGGKKVLDFLSADFGEAYTQLREYDSRIWEMTQFCFLQFMGSIGAVWTIFSFANGKDAPLILVDHWELVSAILLIVSFLFSFLAVQLIMRTRVYLVREAKYIDSQRHYYLQKENNPTGFENVTKYYSHPNKQKYFDPDSTEVLSIYFINLVSSFVFGFGIGLLANYLKMPEISALVLGLIVWVVSGGLKIAYSILYLHQKDVHAGK